MTGAKQFFLEIFNFLVNIILAVIIFLLLNLLFIEIVENEKKLLIINILIGSIFLFLSYIQNIYFPSIFYFFSKYRISSEGKNVKSKIFANNFLFNTTLVGMIVSEVMGANYWIKLIFFILIVFDFIFCFVPSMKKSLLCKLFKINTNKILKSV